MMMRVMRSMLRSMLRRRGVKRVMIGMAVLAVVLGAFVAIAVWRIVWMPGRSYAGTLPAMSDAQIGLRGRLRERVRVLAEEIGERSPDTPMKYRAAQDYIAAGFREAGYEP